MQGKLIYIEGGEGSGKSTQRDRLGDMFTKEGHRVHLAHEPGGGLGEPIRKMLFLPELEALSLKRRRLAEKHLFLADRVVHAEKLEELLKSGCIVLSDRGPWSTVVYQGYAQGIDIDSLIRENAEAMEGVREDLVIVLDGDPAKLKKRLENRGEGNRFDKKSINFHRSVRTGFQILARKNNWPVVDALAGDETKITVQLREIIRERLKF